MNKDSLIYIAGHTGLAGSAIVRALGMRGYANIITCTSTGVDLRSKDRTMNFFVRSKPEYVFMCAGQVGGISANMHRPAEFLYDNLAMAMNTIECACFTGVKKFCYLGSSCMYPRECPQPMREEYLMTGLLEPTNEGYAVAKLAGYELTLAYARQYGMNIITPIPCNLYGRNDHFEPERSHVMSALIRKFVDAADAKAETVEVWGGGNARREFMDVDDFANICIMLVHHYDSPLAVNVGAGKDITIRELAQMIKGSTGFKGRIRYDHSKPEGMPRKCLDVSKLEELKFKFLNKTLEQGVTDMIAEYRRYRAL